LPETLPPRIIQTTFPHSYQPHLCLIATWIPRKVTESDLHELEPNFSLNLVTTLPNWEKDVVAQPIRLLAALLTSNFELLEGEWGIVEAALARQNIPIHYLNSFAFQAAIVIEENPLKWKSFSHFVYTAGVALAVSATAAGHALIPGLPAVGDAAIVAAAEAGFLVVTNGLPWLARRWEGIMALARGDRPPPQPSSQPKVGNVTPRIFPNR
jgi:hypothetical protein